MKILITNPGTKFIPNEEVPVQLGALSKIDDSSCLEVNLTDSLDYTPFHQREEILQTCYLKLRQGGTISLEGADVHALCHNYNNGMLNIEDFNQVVFSSGQVSVNSGEQTKLQLFNLGAKLIDYKIEGPRFFIKMERPKNAD